MSQAIRVLAAIGLIAVLSRSSGPDSSAERAGSHVRDRASQPASLSALPIAAQGQISAALGRDQSTYHVARLTDGFRMENANHGLTMEATSAGIRIRPGAASWGLALQDFGYGGDLRDATRTTPRAAGNRVEYRRDGLTEWYVNGPLGLEQGITLAQPPGKSTGEPLTFRFQLSGELIASADANERDVAVRRPDGSAALRYRGLTAHDATGRELRAWLDVDDGRLTLSVDDAGAQYPLIVDPFIERATLTASDGAAGDQFGFVGVDGDTIVVGAFMDDVGATADQGSAYVFVRPASGWSGPLVEQARLIASDGATGDAFGLQVAVSGDTVVVGARFDDIATRVDQGSAYVFVRPPGGWSGTLTESAKLTASAGAPQDLFGDRVAIDGDTIVVGARFDDIPGGCLFCDPIINRGSAYVFVRPASGWSGNLTQNATLNSTAISAVEFGVSVAIRDATVVVGAWRSSFDRGAAHVFVRPAAGWSGNLFPNASLFASDAVAGDLFGVSVGLSGDTVAVGAYRDDTGPTTDHGSAYVFVRPSSGWSGNLTQSAKLTASDGAANDEFGNPLAVSGDTIVVGAVIDDVGANADQGSVYVFREPAGGWSGALNEDEKLVASDGAASDLFGNSVSMSGNAIVVGVPRRDSGPNADQGTAYVFLRNLLPSLLLPADITAEATSPAGATVMFDVDAIDFEDGPLTPSCVPASGSAFPLGTTQVDCTVSDSAGEQATGSFSVTVVDTTPPALLLPDNVTEEATGQAGALVSYSVTANDLVDGAVTPLCSPASGAQFPLGVTTVTCAAADAAGNSVSGTFTVTVETGTAGFGSFNALAQIVLRPGTNDDLFAVEAMFVLAPTSDGIDPLTEPVTLVLAQGSWTVLPGAFRRTHFGGFVFDGIVGTTRLTVVIQPLHGGRLALVAVGSGADLTGVANPVVVGLAIGNDAGAAVVTAKIKGG